MGWIGLAIGIPFRTAGGVNVNDGNNSFPSGLTIIIDDDGFILTDDEDKIFIK